MKCNNPLCIHYYEIPYMSDYYDDTYMVRPICQYHDFDINYNNLDRIENCTHHKTYQQICNERKKYL